jgi:hypothetical protein
MSHGMIETLAIAYRSSCWFKYGLKLTGFDSQDATGQEPAAERIQLQM